MDQFEMTKKCIGEKNAKLAMIYKVQQRNEMNQEAKKVVPLAEGEEAAEGEVPEEEQGLIEIEAEEAPEGSEDDENLLTMNESNGEGDEENADTKPVDEMFLVNQQKNQAVNRCMRLLRFVQLMTEGHHT